MTTTQVQPRIQLSVCCHTCRVHHDSTPKLLDGEWMQHVTEFYAKHSSPNCRVEYWSPARLIPGAFANSEAEKNFERIGKAPWWMEHPEFTPNANIKLAVAASVALTFTSLNSLASDTNLLAGASALAVSNTTNLYLDYLVSGFVTNIHTPAPTVGKEIDVYAYANLDDTPTYPDTLLGTDATKTLTTANIQASGLAPFGSAIIAATVDQKNWFRGKSIASAFGGICPNLWSLFVVHNSGQALNSSGGTFSYIPVYMTAI